ncbi:NAD-dependent epimerase/dehydratase family protein [soil metagenome]
MKSLVIGGNGFIGTNLVDGLLSKGHAVKVFDRYPSRFREANPAVEYVVGDLGNHGEVADVVQGVDFVFHLAYTSLPHTSNEDPVYDIRSNVVDTVQMLQQCSTAAVRKVVFVSSGGTVYGIPKNTPIGEDDATDPICSYGITKLAIEKYLHLFHRLHGLDYVVARISNPYGEQQNPDAKQGAVTVFLGNLKRGNPITIWGDGEVVRDYIYIGDAVQALVKSAEYQPGANQHRVFNIGAGRGYSLNQLIAAMRGVVGREIDVRYTPGRVEDVPSNVLDIGRATAELGWKPEVELEEGLSRTWEWLKTLQLA